MRSIPKVYLIAFQFSFLNIAIDHQNNRTEMKSIIPKPLLLFFISGFFLCTQARSQESDPRVLQIKKWYAEVVALNKKAGKFSCTRDVENIKGHNGRYDQILRECTPGKDYQYVEVERDDWEFHSKTQLYNRRGKLFFIFSVWSNVCEEIEYRVYFDEQQRPFRFLERVIFSCEREDAGKNRTVRDIRSQQSMLTFLKEQFDPWPSVSLPY
jgi:hypothetical protein